MEIDNTNYEIPTELLLKIAKDLGIDTNKPITSIVSIISNNNN